jgi:hypothetical protein
MGDHSAKDLENARCYIDLALHCAHCGPESAGPAPDDPHACTTCYGPLVLTDARGAEVLREMYGRGPTKIEAVCPDCGPSVACDEDLCCATCGRDVILCADRYATEVLGEVLGEVLAEAEARGYRRGVAAAVAALARLREGREAQMAPCTEAGGHLVALSAKIGELARAEAVVGALAPDTASNPREPSAR